MADNAVLAELGLGPVVYRDTAASRLSVPAAKVGEAALWLRIGGVTVLQTSSEDGQSTIRSSDTVIAILELDAGPRTERRDQIGTNMNEGDVNQGWSTSVSLGERTSTYVSDVPGRSQDTRARYGECVFLPQEVIAKRFRVEKLIGRGGMSEVYEATDLELRQRVALKTMNAASNVAEITNRIRQEAVFARQVTHKNVCRVFDVFTHTRTASGSRVSSVPVIAMELLEGETLARRIKRTGPFQAEAALTILRQVAAGLSAAHAAGVLHLDLKPSNIFLVPSSDGERAVITDFGIAARIDNKEQKIKRRKIEGTFAYMAPEQAAGEELAPSTDVFAFAVVAHEMITGEKPVFSRCLRTSVVENGVSKAGHRRKKIPELAARWEHAIQRCLCHDSRIRLGEPQEFIEMIGGQVTAREHSRLVIRKGISATVKVVFLALIAGGVLVAAFISALTSFDNDRTNERKRTSIAVVGFGNQTGVDELQWISDVLPEMLTSELAAGGQLRAETRERVVRACGDLVLEPGDVQADSGLRRLLNVDVLVYGSFTLARSLGPETVRFEITLQRSDGKALPTRLVEHASVPQTLQLVPRIGWRIRDALEVEQPKPEEIWAVRASRPSSIIAARQYALGLSRLRQWDVSGSLEPLQAAIDAEPEFPLSYLALADAWVVLGDGRRARVAAYRAFELAQVLPREERLLVEARYCEIAADHRRAIELYKALFTLLPDNLEYGLRLAKAQVAADFGQDAIVTIHQLRQLPNGFGSDPRIDLIEATAAGVLADFRLKVTAAATAQDKGRALGARSLQAQALLSKAHGLIGIGELATAEQCFHDAREIFRSTGNRYGEAEAVLGLAMIYDDTGQTGHSRDAHREALGIYERLGHRLGYAATLNSLGVSLWNRSVSEAREKFEQAYQIFHEMDARFMMAQALGNIGEALLEEGRLHEAMACFSEAMAIHEEIGFTAGVISALANIGRVQLQRGELDQARSNVEQALERGAELGVRSVLVTFTSTLGHVLLEAGDLAGAENKYRAAIALSQEIDSPRLANEAQRGLATVAGLDDRFADAQQILMDAISVREQLGDRYQERLHRLCLAELSLRQGNLDETEEQLMLARPLLENDEMAASSAATWHSLRALLALRDGDSKLATAEAAMASAVVLETESVLLRLRIEIGNAQVAQVSDDVDESIKQLETVASEARRMALLPILLDSECALAEIEMAAGIERWRERIAAVQRDTEGKQLTFYRARSEVILNAALDRRKSRSKATARGSSSWQPAVVARRSE